MKLLNKTKYLLFAFILLFSFQSNAQITLQVGGGLGYSVPTGDYGGTTVDYYNGTKYGMDPGVNFHAKARIGILFLNAFGEVGYTNFSNEGSINSSDLDKTVKVSNNVFSIKLGPEFKFSIPMSPITPYLDAFVSLNTFSGTVEFKSSPDGLPSSEQDINSASRIVVTEKVIYFL